MKLVKRIKRVAEEFLGLEHWPRNPSVTPANFEEQIYEAIIRPGDYCYDVGANVGDVSLFLARLAGPSGKVIAFEPVLAIYETLRVAVERDSHLKAPIITHPYGLAESEKQARSMYRKDYSEWARWHLERIGAESKRPSK